MNYQEKMEEMINKIPKGQVPRLLLHACCAPCSSYCIEYLSKYFKITLYYYLQIITKTLIKHYLITNLY